MTSVIPGPEDVAGQTEVWEHLKRFAPRAYVQAVVNHENRVGEKR